MLKTMTMRGVLALVLIAGAVGCSSSSGNNVIPGGIAASFAASGTAAAADMVRMDGSATGDLVTVSVMIGGPTTSADLFSFAFDLVLSDAAVAQFISGSATMGDALTASGSQELQVLAQQSGNRVALGVTKLGGSGNGVTAAGEATVVTLQFRLLEAGSTTLTLAGAPGNDPAVLDSAGGVIGTITFDAASATLSGV